MPLKIYFAEDIYSNTDSESDKNNIKEVLYIIKDNNNYLIKKGYIYKVIYKIPTSE